MEGVPSFPQDIVSAARLTWWNRVRALPGISCVRPCKKCRVFTSEQPRWVYCLRELAFSPQEAGRDFPYDADPHRSHRSPRRPGAGRADYRPERPACRSRRPQGGAFAGRARPDRDGRRCRGMRDRRLPRRDRPDDALRSAGRCASRSTGPPAARGRPRSSVTGLAGPACSMVSDVRWTMVLRLPKAASPIRSRATRRARMAARAWGPSSIWVFACSMPSYRCGAVSVWAFSQGRVSASLF